MEKFIKANSIKMTVERTDINPAPLDWKDADHWKCKLCNRARRSMTLVFSKGFGHRGEEPTLAELLECLQSDTAGLVHQCGEFVDDAAAFKNFCGDFGYDEDSRKAERVFKACIRQAEKLYRFLGGEKFDEFLKAGME